MIPSKSPNEIQNKVARTLMKRKLHLQKKKLKKERRKFLAMQEERTGKVEKKEPQTIESQRVPDETQVDPEDQEVEEADEMDEFSPYFSGEVEAKICITTCENPSARMFEFVSDLLRICHNSVFYKRRGFAIKTIVNEAKEHGFTHVIVVNEDRKEINGLLMIHIEEGPTAYFRIRNLIVGSELRGSGVMTEHPPELMLNNFSSTLGHRIARFFGSVFTQRPDFIGRQVVTLHNQRDFIFFRQHRYIFEKAAKTNQKAKKGVQTRIQELGPRFTLKLQSLQPGVFDPLHGDFEWVRDVR